MLIVILLNYSKQQVFWLKLGYSEKKYYYSMHGCCYVQLNILARKSISKILDDLLILYNALVFIYQNQKILLGSTFDSEIYCQLL